MHEQSDSPAAAHLSFNLEEADLTANLSFCGLLSPPGFEQQQRTSKGKYLDRVVQKKTPGLRADAHIVHLQDVITCDEQRKGADLRCRSRLGLVTRTPLDGAL